METNTITLGQVVISKAGRDMGRPFAVSKVVDHQYVELIDGDLRRIEKPKVKKIKHLNVTHIVLSELADLLENQKRITNDFVRKSLESFTFKAE